MNLRKVSTASLAVFALALTACAGGSATQSGAAAGDEAISGAVPGKTNIRVSLFNDFGYTELYKEYMELHPEINIIEERAPNTVDARTKLATNLAAGSGLADIEAVEGDWMPEMIEYSDQWVDLTSDSTKGRWLDWKTKKATDPNGRLLGYGTDSAPNAICYRADLFQAAGLPSDRNEVAKLLNGDWNNYFEVGKKFKAANKDVGWFDSSGSIFQGMISQMPNAFEKSDGTVIPLKDNAEIKKVYDSIVANLDKSAKLQSWSEDWTASFQGDPKFATIACPSWMAGYIEEQATGVKGWDIAPVFPGGASNSGGSYLMVPTQSQHQEEAKKLADWLTAPEQQIKAYKAKDTFPSQVEALKSPEIAGEKSEFFNNAPTGEIYSSQAQAIKVQPYTGKYYASVRDVVGEALNRVDTGAQSAEESWQQALSDFEALEFE
ncbi:MAG: extracellular solute-binding protein [Actinomycetaceae bacterium]|nr:extracellular solute-binding protein [Actinomycetaceae bacterium]